MYSLFLSCLELVNADRQTCITWGLFGVSRREVSENNSYIYAKYYEKNIQNRNLIYQRRLNVLMAINYIHRHNPI